MKHIIIPVDFSKQSEFALQAGAKLAKKHDATLHVLHMLELSDSLVSQSQSDNNNEMMFMLAYAKKQFESFLDKDYLEDVTIEPVIKHHKVYKEVDALSKTLNADLIIMGSQGIKTQDGIFAGSNAEKMVRNSSTPVLIVKSDTKDFELNNVVLATDLSQESVPAFSKVTSLFSTFGSNIHSVYVNRPNKGFINTREFNTKLEAFSQAGATNKVEFISGHNIEDGLLQYAAQTKADCIAVITHGRKGLNHFLKGSVSEDLANHSGLPVMTFKL